MDSLNASHSKLSTSTSTASLSSSSSRLAGLSSNSSKEDGKPIRKSRKRKASAKEPSILQADFDSCTPAPIIRRFSADKAQFKDIVHQYTGFHCPAPPRLHPHDFLSSNSLMAAISKSLQALENLSTYLLLHSSLENNSLLLNEINKSNIVPFLEALKHSQNGGKRDMGFTAMGSNSDTSSFGGVKFQYSCPLIVDCGNPLFSSSLQHLLKDTNKAELGPQVSQKSHDGHMGFRAMGSDTTTSSFGGVELQPSCPPSVDYGNSLFSSSLQHPFKDIHNAILGSRVLSSPISMHKSQLLEELEHALLRTTP